MKKPAEREDVSLPEKPLRWIAENDADIAYILALVPAAGILAPVTGWTASLALIIIQGSALAYYVAKKITS